MPAHGLRTCRKWHLLLPDDGQVAANTITAKAHSIILEGAKTAVILVTFNLVVQKERIKRANQEIDVKPELDKATLRG